MLGTRLGAPKRLDTVEIIVPFVNGSRFIIPCLFILVVLWRLSCFVFFLFICFYLAIFFFWVSLRSRFLHTLSTLAGSRRWWWWPSESRELWPAPGDKDEFLPWGQQSKRSNRLAVERLAQSTTSTGPRQTPTSARDTPTASATCPPEFDGHRGRVRFPDRQTCSVAMLRIELDVVSDRWLPSSARFPKGTFFRVPSKILSQTFWRYTL